MSKKMKGFEMGINVMFSIILVLVFFFIALASMTSSAGYLNEILERFCAINPVWCGIYPPCICCEIETHVKMGYPFEDIYEKDYIWSTREVCGDLLDDNNGRAYWEEDPEYSNCGYTSNTELKSGLIFKETCSIPEEFQREGMPDCVCCRYKPTNTTQIAVIWDMSWRCRERASWSFINESTCGPLYIMPPESQELTLKRIGRYFGTGGQYCEIPFPYNMTEAP